MPRKRQYIVMKEICYLPETEVFDVKQKQKAKLKYNLVNIFQTVFLLCLMIILLLPLLNYPNRMEILQSCNEHGTAWNPLNQTWDLSEEEKLWVPYTFWGKAYDNVNQLENYYHRRNEKAFNDIDPDTVIYDKYDSTAINASKAVIVPAMNQAHNEWNIKYKDLRECAHSFVEHGDYSMIKTLVIGFIVLYFVIFLLSLFVREIFLHYFIKKEFTELEWKKVSRNNIFFIGFWLFISFLFVGYLFLLPERRNSYLNGILTRYWVV